MSAARTGNTRALLTILGPRSRALVNSGDKVADAQARRKFVAAYDAASRLDSDSDDRRTSRAGKMTIGRFPVPDRETRQGLGVRRQRRGAGDP